MNSGPFSHGAILRHFTFACYVRVNKEGKQKERTFCYLSGPIAPPGTGILGIQSTASNVVRNTFIALFGMSFLISLRALKNNSGCVSNDQ